MNCRAGCAACCVAPSISSPIVGMPKGKPAGVPCVQLDAQQRCLLFGNPLRPAVCRGLQPSIEMCGADEDVAATRTHALYYLSELERLTAVDLGNWVDK